MIAQETGNDIDVYIIGFGFFAESLSEFVSLVGI